MLTITMCCACGADLSQVVFDQHSLDGQDLEFWGTDGHVVSLAQVSHVSHLTIEPMPVITFCPLVKATIEG